MSKVILLVEGNDDEVDSAQQRPQPQHKTFIHDKRDTPTSDPPTPKKQNVVLVVEQASAMH